jgi:tetratricopeptide (TPR) repeat protein
MDPASIAFAALAEEYRRAGRYEEAIATCTAGLQRHPAYLSAHVTLGRALIEVGQYDEAREELEHVLRLAPENLAAIRGLAEIHHRRGELPESAEHYAAQGEASAPAAPARATPASATPASTPRIEVKPASFAEPPVAAASDAPPPAPSIPLSQPSATTPSPYGVAGSAPADPAIERLEAFLAVIMRARERAAAEQR